MAVLSIATGARRRGCSGLVSVGRWLFKPDGFGRACPPPFQRRDRFRAELDLVFRRQEVTHPVARLGLDRGRHGVELFDIAADGLLVVAENLSLGLLQFGVGHRISKGLAVGRNDIVRRAFRQHAGLLGRKAGAEEGEIGVVLHARRLLAVHHLIGFDEMRQVGEGRIAGDIALGIQHAPGEHRHCRAGLDERGDVGQIGRGGLVVDRRLAALEGEPPVAAPLHAEDMADVEAEQTVGEHRHEVERGGTLAAIDQLLILDLAKVGRRLHLELGGQITDAAGRRNEHGDQLGIIVAHARIAEQERELRGA